MNKGKIVVIGVGYSPLSKEKRLALEQTERVYLFPGTFELLRRSCEDQSFLERIRRKLREVKKVSDLMERVKEENFSVVLAGGDPLYFGIAESLKNGFMAEVEVLPDLSILQIACAKAGLPVEKVKSISFHGRQLDENLLLNQVSRYPYVGVLTDEKNDVRALAKVLQSFGFEKVEVYLFERLGYPEESCHKLSLKTALNFPALSPHFVILKNEEAGKSKVFGYSEEELDHQRGLITKDEVRALVVHSLALPWRGVIWDVGAGSGSVSIEMASFSPYLTVCAIEKDLAQCEIIESNRRKYHLPNLKVFHSLAPDGFKELPSPDRVFLGGSGKKLEEILLALHQIPTWEVLVATFATLENFLFFFKFFSDRGLKVEAKQVWLARMVPFAQKHHLKPLNPVLLAKVKRK